MSQYTGPYSTQDRGSGAEPSTTDVARDEAAGVGQHARDAGGQVAQTAADQAREVVAETGRQARDLLDEAQGQARDQASAQQQKAAQQLRTVADELHEMAANGGQSGLATEVARQAADRMQGAASWLEQREPRELLEGVRNFARRRPGTFLVGAAVAGLAAGRLTRGLTAGSGRQNGPQRSTVTGTPSAATADSPADAGYPAEVGYPASTDAAYSTTPMNPVEPAYPADPAYPSGPAYPVEPGYSAGEPAYPAEPGSAPRFSGPGQP